MADADPTLTRVTLFRNAGLEALTFISVRWFLVIWAPVLTLIALAGIAAPDSPDAPQALMLVVAGLASWFLFEYCAHRFLFHWDSASRPGKWFVFLIHGNHHVTSNDPLRNLMPPIVSLPVGGLIWMVFLALAGSSGTWLLLGFMTGYVAYDLTHYACHQYPMRGAIGHLVKRHHMRHHFREGGNFAITALFLDRVFGTRVPSGSGKSGCGPL